MAKHSMQVAATLKKCAIIGAVMLVVALRPARAKDVLCTGGHACQNDATCIKVEMRGKTNNMCICKPGFTGWNCALNLDYCNKHCRSYSKDVQCQQALCNQGTCVNQTEYPFYSCNCGPFYSGSNCEIDNNPCSQMQTNPCDHGDCTFVRGTNQVLCQCHTGWTANKNQQFVKLNWNGADIFVAPPCNEEIRRGIIGSATTLPPGAKIIWYTVYFISIALLLWLIGTMLYKYFARTQCS